MRYWWVNHKQTFRHEIGGGYIWCPKTRKDGVRNHFYETLREVGYGDVVFSFAFGQIQAMGTAVSSCFSCPRPNEFGKVGDSWNELGWRANVNFHRFPKPLSVQSSIAHLRPFLPQRHSPIRENGYGNQGAYLAEISLDLAAAVVNQIDPELTPLLFDSIAADLSPALGDYRPSVIIDWEDRIQQTIEARADIPQTTRRALIDARRGQGRFRAAVNQLEPCCRITKVDNRIHLIASHIKPWREATDDERLTGSNGLLLTPSIDHLFDRGFISFTDEGDLLISPTVDIRSVRRMGIDPERAIATPRFNTDQRYFLNYHRERVFLQAAA